MRWFFDLPVWAQVVVFYLTVSVVMMPALLWLMQRAQYNYDPDEWDDDPHDWPKS